MRMLMLVAAFAAVPLRGEEPPPPRLREMLHALIMESLPDLPAPPALPYAEPAEPVIRIVKTEDDVVVLEPIVVSESRGVRGLEKMIARAKAQDEKEKFSAIEGGTIFRMGRLEFGTWGGKGGGLGFVKIDF